MRSIVWFCAVDIIILTSLVLWCCQLIERYSILKTCFTSCTEGSLSEELTWNRQAKRKWSCFQCISCTVEHLTVGKFHQSRSVWGTRQRLHDCGSGSVEWTSRGSGAKHWKSDHQQQLAEATLSVHAGLSLIFHVYWLIVYCINCLQCFDAVGWAAGRASGM